MTTYGRALLTFHHILSTRKKEIIKDSARKLNLVGVCKVGYPGVLAVEGSELQVKQYIREIKSLRWQSCTTINVTSGLEVDQLCMSIDGQSGIKMVEKMQDFGAMMRATALEEWWRKGMGYTKRNP